MDSVTPTYRYLAAPYSSGIPRGRSATSVRVERLRKTKYAVALLLRLGERIVSPVLACHEVAPLVGGHDWSTWRDLDRALISGSAGLMVLPLEGWSESEGVLAELDFAREQRVPVEILSGEFLERLEAFENAQNLINSGGSKGVPIGEEATG